MDEKERENITKYLERIVNCARDFWKHRGTRKAEVYKEFHVTSRKSATLVDNPNGLRRRSTKRNEGKCDDNKEWFGHSLRERTDVYCVPTHCL